MQRGLRSRLRSDAYRRGRRVPGGIALGQHRRRAFGAVGLRRPRHHRRHPVSSVLLASMPDWSRMHAPNTAGASERDGPSGTRSRAGVRMKLGMSGLEGVQVSRGGWRFVWLDYDARFSEEMREQLIDNAFAAIDGTLSRRIRRSRHAETW